MPDLHIAVDTGGTFTDIGVRRADGSLAVWKVPSTPHAPDEAVITGITGALEREDAQPAQVTRLVHGTTVATNTVLTRTGARRPADHARFPRRPRHRAPGPAVAVRQPGPPGAAAHPG